ncbi:hypothetical protein GPECTOR_107g143 [Gonium pectorale]|uniref:Uncharacterized protein n=1 Tax=Gonium pectorale TaxID=33097 RepID=A0A150FZI6_GONPE|nr:hypothetical protein GPECTOR_107g143 [Gonium pectorale]|eukprot:KXZ42999.1 hypothetical protein GPECTOR_107g143 [Gonium pectorale]
MFDWFVSRRPPLYLWILKAELSATFLSPSAFVGVDFGFFSWYSSIGSYTFVEDKYLKEPRFCAQDLLGTSTARGMPIKAFSLRMETNLGGGGDDTALNGIR